MKYKILFFLFFTKIFVFAQEFEKHSYSFDTFTSYLETVYSETSQKNNYVILKNSKNKDVSMVINNNLKIARLFDFTNGKMFFFDLKNRIENISNLKNLDTAIYNSKSKITMHKNSCNCDKDNILVEVEQERDTIQNKFIVHKIIFKNHKKKKILHEDYYIFKLTNSNFTLDKSLLKEYLSENYNIPFIENEDIEKIICVQDNKKISETEYIITKRGNINLNFVANQ